MNDPDALLERATKVILFVLFFGLVLFAAYQIGAYL